jgi:hypothetical protein
MKQNLAVKLHHLNPGQLIQLCVTRLPMMLIHKTIPLQPTPPFIAAIHKNATLAPFSARSGEKRSVFIPGHYSSF